MPWLLDGVVILIAVDWAYLHHLSIVNRRRERGGAIQSVTTDDVISVNGVSPYIMNWVYKISRKSCGERKTASQCLLHEFLVTMFRFFGKKREINSFIRTTFRLRLRKSGCIANIAWSFYRLLLFFTFVYSYLEGHEADKEKAPPSNLRIFFK